MTQFFSIYCVQIFQVGGDPHFNLLRGRGISQCTDIQHISLLHITFFFQIPVNLDILCFWCLFIDIFHADFVFYRFLFRRTWNCQFKQNGIILVEYNRCFCFFLIPAYGIIFACFIRFFQGYHRIFTDTLDRCHNILCCLCGRTVLRLCGIISEEIFQCKRFGIRITPDIIILNFIRTILGNAKIIFDDRVCIVYRYIKLLHHVFCF